MRSQKQYTNQTFTKRVDHEAGRHRTRRACAEPAVCKICRDVYADRRWSQPGIENTRQPEARPATEIICPACQRQADGVASGYVHLRGAYLVAHREDIERLLHNEAARAAEDNPLARIIDTIQDAPDQLTLTTTTEHLAQRLGHALKKAHHGKARYDFSHENKLAHVYWQRD